MKVSADKIRLAVFIAALFLIFSSRSGWTKTYVVFRYDDFAADQNGFRSESDLRANLWKAEQQVDSLFEKYRCPYVVSIIPCSNSLYSGTYAPQKTVSFTEDKEKAALIQKALKAGRIEVAQHGFSHNNSAGEHHRKGEFREKLFDWQYEKIKNGKQVLCEALGIQTISTFVPPFNGWNGETAKALKKADFKILSSDRYYYSKHTEGLRLIPFTAQLWDLEEMLRNNELARNGLMVVLYHPPQITRFDGMESRYFGVERFEELLKKLSSRTDIEVTTLNQLVENRGDHLTDERFRAANSLWKERSFWKKLIPQKLLPGENTRAYYLSASEYNKLDRRWGLLKIGFVGGLVAVGLGCNILVKNYLNKSLHIYLYSAATFLFICSVLKELQILNKGYHLTGISLIPAAFAAPFVISLLGMIFTNYRNKVISK